MIPNGKLKVDGGAMLTVHDRLVHRRETGKRRQRHHLEHVRLSRLRQELVTVASVKTIIEEPIVKTAFEATAYPNPSRTDFRFAVIGMDQTKPVLVRITDISGRVMMTKTATIAKGGTIRLGNELKAGSYFAEISQGNDRKVIKLVKLN